jgi:hypothetical protein
MRKQTTVDNEQLEHLAFVRAAQATGFALEDIAQLRSLSILNLGDASATSTGNRATFAGKAACA